MLNHKELVADTSVLMTFGVVERLDLLCRNFGEVLLPTAVGQEAATLEVRSQRIPLWEALSRAGCFRLVDLPGEAARQAEVHERMQRVDRGEAAVVAYAMITDALTLIDDLPGRRLAVAQRVAVTGTLGILSRSKRQGYIQEVEPWITAMQKNGRFFRPELIEEFLRKEGEWQ